MNKPPKLFRLPIPSPYSSEFIPFFPTFMPAEKQKAGEIWVQIDMNDKRLCLILAGKIEEYINVYGAQIMGPDRHPTIKELNQLGRLTSPYRRLFDAARPRPLMTPIQRWDLLVHSILTGSAPEDDRSSRFSAGNLEV